MGLWTELGKALGDLALLNFKAEENLPANNFYKNRIQKLEKDGAAIHGRISEIDEARSRVPPLSATPTEHYMNLNNVTRELELFYGSITALEQHMDIDIRLKQERERVMGRSVTGREVDLGQEPTQVIGTVGGNVLEAFRGSNAQRLLQSPARSISTEVTEVTPAPAARARGLLLNNQISMGLVTPTPRNNQNSSLSVNSNSTPVVRRRMRIDTSSDEDDETVFGLPSPSPCLCSSCSQNFGSQASTTNNVSSPEPETPSSSYSSHSVCENCGAPRDRDESFGFSLNSPNSTISDNCSSLSPASSLPSPCLCPNCAPHLHLRPRRSFISRNW